MAKYSKKELRSFLSIQANYLNSYISKGSVIVNENNEIDDRVPENADFIKRMLDRKKQKERKEKAEKGVKDGNEVAKDNVKVDANLENRYSERANELQDEIKNQKFSTDLEGKTAYELKQIKEKREIEYKETQIALNEIKRQKLEAELVPTDLIRSLFARNAKSITTAFHQELDTYITRLQARLKLSSEEVSKMRKEVIETTNKAIEDATSQSKDDLKKIVEEYSNKRERGERK